ncbi:MAG: hypothetical protein U1U88_000026, partial [Lawsonella clevelandensis]
MRMPLFFMVSGLFAAKISAFNLLPSSSSNARGYGAFLIFCGEPSCCRLPLYSRHLFDQFWSQWLGDHLSRKWIW